MITTPLVTIAMITYNSAAYVQVAIESVLNQTYNNFELLISDDASTDSTWQIITSYSDARIRALRNENNIGEYQNRNKVISLSKGEYFIFIDGDDVLYPYGIKFMITMLQAFPESAMALSMPPRSYFIYPVELTPKQIYGFDYLGQSITHHGFPYTFFRTKILQSIGKIPEEYKTGDTYIKKLICLTNNVLLIPEGTAWWRETPGQASSKLKKNMTGQIEALKYNLYFLDHTDCPLSMSEINTAKRILTATFLKNVVYKYFFKLKICTAIKIIKKANINWADFKNILIKVKQVYTSNANSVKPLTNRRQDPYLKNFDSI